MPFAIGPALVGPGETERFLVEHREPFRPKRIHGGMPSHGLVIVDVLVGEESYFMPGEAIPASSPEIDFYCSVVSPGVGFTVVVHNPTDGVLVFACSVLAEIHP